MEINSSPVTTCQKDLSTALPQESIVEESREIQETKLGEEKELHDKPLQTLDISLPQSLDFGDSLVSSLNVDLTETDFTEDKDALNPEVSKTTKEIEQEDDVTENEDGTPKANSPKITPPALLELKRSSSGESLADVIQTWESKFDSNEDSEESPLDLLPLPKLEADSSWLNIFDKKSASSKTPKKNFKEDMETVVENHGDYQVVTTVYKKTKPLRPGTPPAPKSGRDFKPMSNNLTKSLFRFDAASGTFMSSLPLSGGVSENFVDNASGSWLMEKPDVAPAAEKATAKTITPEPKPDKTHNVATSPKKVSFGVAWKGELEKVTYIKQNDTRQLQGSDGVLLVQRKSSDF